MPDPRPSAREAVGEAGAGPPAHPATALPRLPGDDLDDGPRRLVVDDLEMRAGRATPVPGHDVRGPREGRGGDPPGGRPSRVGARERSRPDPGADPAGPGRA